MSKVAKAGPSSSPHGQLRFNGEPDRKKVGTGGPVWVAVFEVALVHMQALAAKGGAARWNVSFCSVLRRRRALELQVWNSCAFRWGSLFVGAFADVGVCVYSDS